jgi:hypothetical protein
LAFPWFFFVRKDKKACHKGHVGTKVLCYSKKNVMENTENKETKTVDTTSVDRTTGRGGKDAVSRSGNTSENEDVKDNDLVDENLQNKLNQEDAGTGVDIEDDRRNERKD